MLVHPWSTRPYLCDERTGDIVRAANANEIALAKSGRVVAYFCQRTGAARTGFLARLETSTDSDGDRSLVAIALDDDEIATLEAC